MNNKLNITNELYIGQGAHKKVFIHPKNSSLCIKILFKEPDEDLNKELNYRKSRRIRKLNSDILPKYYGTIETNIGTGYIFERILDYDQKTSITMQQYLDLLVYRRDINISSNLYNLLLDFRNKLMEEKIILPNMVPINFLIQKINKNKLTVRIVDNIGSATHIPLAFYINFFADRHIKKYWNNFINDLNKKYPNDFDWDILTQLKFQ